MTAKVIPIRRRADVATEAGRPSGICLRSIEEDGEAPRLELEFGSPSGPTAFIATLTPYAARSLRDGLADMLVALRLDKEPS